MRRSSDASFFGGASESTMNLFDLLPIPVNDVFCMVAIQRSPFTQKA